MNRMNAHLGVLNQPPGLNIGAPNLSPTGHLAESSGHPPSTSPSAVSSGRPPLIAEFDLASPVVDDSCQSDRQSFPALEPLDSISQTGSNPGIDVIMASEVHVGKRESPPRPEESETKRSRSDEGQSQDVDMHQVSLKFLPKPMTRITMMTNNHRHHSHHVSHHVHLEMHRL